MQKDFFDDQDRDVVSPAQPEQVARTHAPEPSANVIDAEVVEEVQAARPHAEAEYHDGPSPKNEKLMLFAFVAVLLGGIILLQGQTKALQATNFAENTTLNVPVIVRYEPIQQTQKIQLTQDERMQVSFAEIAENAASLRESVKALSRPKVNAKNKVLNQADYAALKEYLAEKEGISNDDDVRDILLQAGYTLPARLPDEEHVKRNKNRDHVAFARDVINRLLKDEVEDFLEKVQIASEVGVYVAESATEE